MKKDIAFNGRPIALEYQTVTKKNPYFHEKVLEVTFVMEGEIEFVRQGEETHILKPGDFISVDPGRLHTVESAKGAKITSLYFDFDYYMGMLPFIHGIAFDALSINDTSNECKMLRNYFIRTLIAVLRHNPFYESIVEEISESMLILLNSYFMNYSYIRAPLPHLKDEVGNRVHQYAAFISKQYKEKDFSVADVAGHLNLSVTRMNHFLKDNINISFQDSLRLYRLGEAERLLLSTNFSVGKISDMCGFSDEKYLYKHFGNYYNMTPGEYRKMHLKRHKESDMYTVFELHDKVDEIADYIRTYYEPIEDYSFLEGNPEKMNREVNIGRVYDYAFTYSGEKIETFILLEENKSFLYKNGRLSINWEYIYELVDLFMKMDNQIDILVDMSKHDSEVWETAMMMLWDGLRKIYSEKVYDKFRVRLLFQSREQRKEASNLTKYLRENEIHCDIEPVIIF